MDKFIKLVSRIAFLNFFVIVATVLYLRYTASQEAPAALLATPEPHIITEIVYLSPSSLPKPTPIIILRTIKPSPVYIYTSGGIATQTVTTAPVKTNVPAQSQTQTTTTAMPTNLPTATAAPTAPPDPFAQLSQHSTQSDCWIRVNNSVYNITGYFGMHPGGNGVMSPYCGKDATTAFNTKNMGSSHSQSAKTLLESFKVN